MELNASILYSLLNTKKSRVGICVKQNVTEVKKHILAVDISEESGEHPGLVNRIADKIFSVYRQAIIKVEVDLLCRLEISCDIC